jgi:PIN domain nuclease of toxin-antitoxin system
LATLLDAYPLLALLLDEPAAAEVEPLLAAGGTAVPAVQLAELIDLLERRERLPPAEVKSSVGTLLLEVETRPLAEAEAWRAADLRARYYQRRTRALSLADCLLLASAADGDRIATSDPAVAEVARAEAIPVVALPDSAGRRP